MTNTEDLRNLRCTKKLYDSIIKTVCEKYSLGRPELDIIAFLHTNTDLDIASDIVEYCMLSKANVSQAVERLIKRQLIERVVDPLDRRRIHLSLTELATSIIEDFDNAYAHFRSVLVSGLTDDELALYNELSRKMANNAVCYLEK